MIHLHKVLVKKRDPVTHTRFIEELTKVSRSLSTSPLLAGHPRAGISIELMKRWWLVDTAKCYHCLDGIALIFVFAIVYILPASRCFLILSWFTPRINRDLLQIGPGFMLSFQFNQNWPYLGKFVFLRKYILFTIRRMCYCYTLRFPGASFLTLKRKWDRRSLSIACQPWDHSRYHERHSLLNESEPLKVLIHHTHSQGLPPKSHTVAISHEHKRAMCARV